MCVWYSMFSVRRVLVMRSSSSVDEERFCRVDERADGILAASMGAVYVWFEVSGQYGFASIGSKSTVSCS